MTPLIRRLFRTKAVNADLHPDHRLHNVLSAFDLTLLGVGAIIGAGVFVLTGVAAAVFAGPAVIFSYLLAGIACGFTALSYAELSSSIGGCGSAYGYAYAGLGELIAWIIGWNLLLEYGIACPAVAVGWSGYMQDVLHSIGIILPTALTKCPSEGGVINLPASLIILVMMFLLLKGIHQSSKVNAAIVFIKLLAVAIFVIAAIPHFSVTHWQPFLPFGWHGVFSGAAIIFFAYIGFDAVSTAAEEAKNPQRDLPIGIIGSLVVCTVVYMLVAGLLTGISSYTQLNVSSPVANALLQYGNHFVAGIIGAGAVAGLTTVIFVMFYGLTRILFAMGRDKLLPKKFVRLNSQRTPIFNIILCGILMALIAGFVPMETLAELVNIGTLAAFIIVCIGVIVLRYTQPDLHRPFRIPFSPFVPAIGTLLCLFLMWHLSAITWYRFVIWTAIGVVVYFGYGFKRNT